ncbi:Glycosyl transferase, group 1 [Candidatus Sulfopaludibacter sp. SbA3]|nr:Glycosyl transferase, group 1 [Candidatus Sulfopaludibacter sp. SbA3]
MQIADAPVTAGDTAARKPVVLVLLGHYLPGYRAGGPIRSIANMIEALGEEMDFRVVSSDRDIGASAPFSEVETCQWVSVGKASVCYLPNTWRALWTLVRTLIVTPADLLYLNSFFARRYSMLALFLRRLWLFRPKSVLLAPRGEFSVGALKIKSWRKRAYIALARTAGLYSNVLWHASSQFEERDIHHAFCSIAVAGPIAAQTGEAGRKLRIMTALDLPGAACARCDSQKRAKAAGSIRLVFLSRISRKKNLDGAISMLRELYGDIQFDIYGPIEDHAYWKACQGLMPQLPANVHVTYRGETHHDLVHRVLSEYDVLFLPTHGENYGHVIREALSAGCPVIVSDQTPWRGLEALGVGWDVPLTDIERFRTAIQSCIDMHPEVFAKWAVRAYEYGFNLAKDPEIIRQNQRLFARALDRKALLQSVGVGDGR